MIAAKRSLFILILSFAIASQLCAQETTATTTTEQTQSAQTTADPQTETAAPADATTTAESDARTPTTEGRKDGSGAVLENQPPDASKVREAFTALLYEYPSELASILKLEPTLLRNEAFLSAYPPIAEFLRKHPEVVQHPRYYLSAFLLPPAQQESVFEQIFEGLTILATVSLVAFSLGWLLRTILEQKRWNRLSKIQTEAHNKILDRFGSSEEVLEYLKSSAGTKFLESAPIPLHSERPTPRPQSAPLPRAMWTVQAGVVAIALGAGLLLVSLRFEGESSHGLFSMGMIALFLGIGFIGSVAVSTMLSRRLGLMNQAEPTDVDGIMR